MPVINKWDKHSLSSTFSTHKGHRGSSRPQGRLPAPPPSTVSIPARLGPRAEPLQVRTAKPHPGFPDVRALLPADALERVTFILPCAAELGARAPATEHECKRAAREGGQIQFFSPRSEPYLARSVHVAGSLCRLQVNSLSRAEPGGEQSRAAGAGGRGGRRAESRRGRAAAPKAAAAPGRHTLFLRATPPAQTQPGRTAAYLPSSPPSKNKPDASSKKYLNYSRSRKQSQS